MSILEEVHNAYQTLINGGTILYPTDTVWGLGCDATNSLAIDKIYQIKNRPNSKSYIILVPNIRTLLQYISAPPLDIDDIINQNSEKPTTFILEGAINLPDNLINQDGSIAIRIPKDDFCIQLLKKLRKPLVSTSANISGDATARIFSEINPDIITSVDYATQHRQTDTTIHQPSRIIKINNDGSTTIVRA